MPMPLGKKHSEETKKKMSQTHKLLGHKPPTWLGKKHSEETKKKMSLHHRKQTKEQIENLIKRNKDPNFWTKERRLKASIAGKKKKLNLEALKITHLKNIGKKRTSEQRLNISNSLKGSKSSFWKGGVTPVNRKIRASSKYKEWRKSCFERDNYTCQICFKRNTFLEVHHIKSFSENPKDRFNKDNGITVCRECHRLTDNFGSKNAKKRTAGTNIF